MNAHQLTTSRRIRLGAAIRALRQERGLSIADLSIRSGIRSNELVTIERGLRTVSPFVAADVAKGLGVSLAVLDERARQGTNGSTSALLADSAEAIDAGWNSFDLDSWRTEIFGHVQRQYAVLGFTPREQDVADQILHGMTTTGGIARALELQPNTIKNISQSIYRKAGVKDRAALILKLVDMS